MKKIMIFVAACVALAACTKDIDTTTSKTGDANAFEKGQQVTLSLSAGEQTKVSSELVTSGTNKDKVNFKWETGDKVKVTVGTESAEFTLSSGAGTTSATFIGTMPAAGETFDVQYPYTTPSLAEQTYSGTEAIPHDKMLLSAKDCSIAGGTFTLTAQNAALRLNLYGTNKTIGKIVVTNTTSIDTPKPNYTLTCTDGKTIGATALEPTAFFIVVPVGNYKFSAEFFDNAATPASLCKFETTNAQTFTANQVMNMPAREVIKVHKVFNVGEQTSEMKLVAGSKNIKWNRHAYTQSGDWTGYLEIIQNGKSYYLADYSKVQSLSNILGIVVAESTDQAGEDAVIPCSGQVGTLYCWITDDGGWLKTPKVIAADTEMSFESSWDWSGATAGVSSTLTKGKKYLSIIYDRTSSSGKWKIFEVSETEPE